MVTNVDFPKIYPIVESSPAEKLSQGNSGVPGTNDGGLGNPNMNGRRVEEVKSHKTLANTESTGGWKSKLKLGLLITIGIIATVALAGAIVFGQFYLLAFVIGMPPLLSIIATSGLALGQGAGIMLITKVIRN